MKRFLLVLAAALLCTAVQAKVEPAHIFSDGMVLQQQSDAAIWGTAAPGAQISISASWGASARCKAGTDGKWRTSIKTPAASYKPYTLKISGDGSVTINDVLVGEVWLASGQSNMEMPMRGFFNCPVENALEYIAAPPAREKVRMFFVPNDQSYEVKEDVDAQWHGADASTRKEMSAVAYFYALKLNEVLDVPVGIVANPYGGAKIESWLPREVLEKYDDVDLDKAAIDAIPVSYLKPMLMYNAMLYPLRGYTIKGFIWYQGCSNVGQYSQFVDRMTDLVATWRADWNDKECKLPFYTVEIAPYRYKPESAISYASLLRQAQHDACKVIENYECVVTNDLAYDHEKDNIHPSQKKAVGDRLAYLALNRDYGFKDIDCYSPEAVKLVELPNSSEIGVDLTHCEHGLSRWIDIRGLEVAGSEGVFYPVTYAYFEWNPRVLRVRSEFVFDPKEVRYGWGDFNPGNLYNCEGLPVTPFWLKK
jgi:Domain of unknown function (DUF303).